MYLPGLDTANAVAIDPTTTTEVAVPVRQGEPPVEMMVEAGTLVDQNGNLFTGQVSITEVPPQLTPAALPPNLFPDLVVTIQPGEMVFNTPAPITFPNTGGFEPGLVMDLWSINPVSGEFEIVGKMQTDYQHFDLDYVRTFKKSRRFTLDWRAGIRLASVRQTMDMAYRQNGSFAVYALTRID